MSDTTVYILSVHLLSGECTYSRNIVVWFLLSVYGFYCASKFENCLFLAFESENRDLKLILRQTEKELEDYKTKYKSQETIVQSQVGEFEDKVFIFFYTKQIKTIYMYHTSKWIDPMYISLCCHVDSTWFFFVRQLGALGLEFEKIQRINEEIIEDKQNLQVTPSIDTSSAIETLL